jgi:hypothetical protein
MNACSKPQARSRVASRVRPSRARGARVRVRAHVGVAGKRARQQRVYVRVCALACAESYAREDEDGGRQYREMVMYGTAACGNRDSAASRQTNAAAVTSARSQRTAYAREASTFG